jgi:exonuclease SbcC
MILKSLTLHNIRSYKDHGPIRFSPGILLFEGDVGSGKSTILSAVEFALFGLGDVDGRYLLRAKEKEGRVLLEFEINGEKYKVFRSLVRRRKYVVQGEGHIVENSVRTDYSVSEMKARILKILDFNERPRPKTSSLIFRYAIFTPQEMMKEVLYQRVERRLETLRRAFGVEDYSIASRNAEVLRGHLKEHVTFIKGQTEDLEQKRSSLDSEKKRLRELNVELEKLDKEFKKVDKKLNRLKKRLETLGKKRDEVLALQKEIEHLKGDIEKDKKNLKSLEDDVKQLLKEKEESKTAEQNLEKLKPQYEEYKTIKSKITRLEKINKQFQSLHSEEEKLNVAICKIGEGLEKEIKKTKKEVSKLKGGVSREKPKLERMTDLKTERKTLKKKVQKLSALAKRISELKQKKASNQAEINGLKKELTRKKREWKNIETIGIGAPCPRCHQELTKEHYDKVEQEYTTEFNKLNTEIEKLSKAHKLLVKRIESMETKEAELDTLRKRLTKLNREIATLKEKGNTVKKTERKIKLMLRAIERNEKKLKENKYAMAERKRIDKISKKLDELKPKKELFEELSERIKKLEEEEIEKLYTENKQIAARKKRILKQINTKQSRLRKLEKEIKKREGQCSAKSKRFDKEKDVLEKIKKLEQDKNELESEWKTENNLVISKKTEIREQDNRVKQIGKEIKEKEELLLNRFVYEQYLLWIDEHFLPAIESIERHVMASIRGEFNELFQKWFSQLIETGEITVRIDENFTPLVEQSGYELDVASLSGGEKTSVALAYRLALNVLVKKVCEAMHSNILMLDEPTDGFSTEQMFRMRNILNELKCEQVIMVSHERELEGFADKIYRVRKDAGTSTVMEAAV